MNAVARQNRTWHANETWRLAAILAVVKSQTWRSQPYWEAARTTHTVTPMPKI